MLLKFGGTFVSRASSANGVRGLPPNLGTPLNVFEASFLIQLEALFQPCLATTLHRFEYHHQKCTRPTVIHRRQYRYREPSNDPSPDPRLQLSFVCAFCLFFQFEEK